MGYDEREFDRLVPTQWTEAQRTDAGQYAGDEVLQFARNTDPYRAGQRTGAADALPHLDGLRPQCFNTYTRGSLRLARGDVIRITAGGKSLDGKHALTNGGIYTFDGFTRSGDIALSNGWTISKSIGHISHAYVATQLASQGRTVCHTIFFQSEASLPATSQQGFYVAASRGRQSCTVFTDDFQSLRQAIQRSRTRRSATETIKPNWWGRVKQTATRMK